ncbi:MAG TPA: YsnF/AvaK domain-containing protein [Tepidisphaeraceae bacterium]|jgi:stress response protein YsnF
MTSSEKHVLVYGPHGPVGTIDRSDWIAKPARLYLTLTDGRQVLLRPELLTERDGIAFLSHDVANASPTSHDQQSAHASHTPPTFQNTPAAMVVPVAQEEFNVDTRVVEDVVRVNKTVHEREVVVDPALLQEAVSVERVRIDRVIEKPVQIRQEGDVTIVPVMEEVYVVEKRLMLREEVRLTKRRTEVHDPQTLKLKYEEVVVERVPGRAPAAPAARGNGNASGASERANERV